jgi:hypothetical protein
MKSHKSNRTRPVPTQPGNPHQLVRQQHIFPNCSINRFCDETGVVDLKMFQPEKRRFAKSTDKIFCVERAWDERAEQGYGKNIEDNFQNIVERTLQNNCPIVPSEHLLLTQFYALWNVRYHWSRIPLDDEPIKGVKGLELSLTLDDQERFEKAHILHPTNELTVPARQLRGLAIQRNIDAVVEAMFDVEWGILYASEGEFIVPDNFLLRNILPINPKVCFVARHESGVLDKKDVGLINSLAIQSAEKYIFARNLDTCPGINN